MRVKFQNPTTIFQFFYPPICQYVIVRGVGVLDLFFDWNVILSVTQDQMQKFKIPPQFFNYFTPQYVIVRGVGSRFFFKLECYSIS